MNGEAGSDSEERYSGWLISADSSDERALAMASLESGSPPPDEEGNVCEVGEGGVERDVAPDILTKSATACS